MKKRVAVEGSLTGIKSFLKNEGFEVVSPGQGQQVDAIITTGLDNNVMDMQDITTKAAVIDASGKTAEEILQRLQEIK